MNIASSPPNDGTSTEASPELQRVERLKRAVRQARVDDAERTRVISELRGAEIARLEMLRDELQPVIAEVPREADLFDLALVPSERPRLFIDMIAFVEMGRDKHTYRFVQDTRVGRVTLIENDRLEPLVDAVTDYIARRMIEREKSLAGDTTLDQAALARIAVEERLSARRAGVPMTSPRQRKNAFTLLFSFLIQGLGSVALLALLTLGWWTAWKFFGVWLAQHHIGH